MQTKVGRVKTPPFAAIPALALALALALSLALVSASAFAHVAYASTTVKAADVTSGETAGDQAASTAVKAKATVTVRARVQYDGWLKTVKAGKTAGTTSKQGLRAFKLKLSGLKGVKGHVKYRTYDWNKGWGAVAQDGKSSGRPSRAIRAVKIWLTGSVAKEFDVKYRLYVKGKGWLPWAQNKQKAGITTGKYYASAIRVKLVRKTAGEAKTRLNGIDISNWQQGLNPAKVDADFIIAKATEGTWYKDPYFKKFADATLASGKLLGAYHFVRTGDAVKQADYFVKTVGPYIGKCALFLDWEDREGDSATTQGPAWAKKFLDRVYQKTGVKPLIYMNKNTCLYNNWSKVAKSYGLWIAQYLYKYYLKRVGHVADPDHGAGGFNVWKSPTIYQYTSRGLISGYSGNLDLDVFYGSVADWKAMAKK